MKCDIIIPVWNKKELTQNCVESIIRNTHYPYRLVIVDNASSAPAKEYLENLQKDRKADVFLIRNEENQGFTSAVNQGIKASQAEYICILNNDTLVTEGWLEEMVKIAGLKTEIGIVNPSSNTLGSCPPSNSVEDVEGYAKKVLQYKGQYTELGAAVGFCFLIKRAVIEKIGGWDELFSPGYFDDTDYSLRAAQAGYKSVCARAAYVYHIEHASFRDKKMEAIFQRNKKLFYERHGKPQRILFVVDKYQDGLYKIIEKDSYALAGRADWVWIFFKKNMPAPAVPEHGNIRFFLFAPGLFFLKVVYRILMRRKKKFDLIYVTNEKFRQVLDILKFVHRAEVNILKTE